MFLWCSTPDWPFITNISLILIIESEDFLQTVHCCTGCISYSSPGRGTTREPRSRSQAPPRQLRCHRRHSGQIFITFTASISTTDWSKRSPRSDAVSPYVADTSSLMPNRQLKAPKLPASIGLGQGVCILQSYTKPPQGASRICRGDYNLVMN